MSETTDPAAGVGVPTATEPQQPAEQPKAKRTRKTAAAKSADTLTVGDVAAEDVFLRMVGGYGPDFLQPGKAAPGQPGVRLVAKGDTITPAQAARYAAAVERARG